MSTIIKAMIEQMADDDKQRRCGYICIELLDVHKRKRILLEFTYYLLFI